MFGINKPQMLKNQNEDIKRMLGVADDLEKSGTGTKMDAKIGGPSTRLKPVVR